MARLKADWMTEDSVRQLMTVLGAPDVDVRFVGGCVRDTVLSRAIADIDIGTPEHPEAVMKRLQTAGLRVIPTGLQHGTVTAVVDKRNFEITTLRRDTACDGRHAEVEFTDDWHADAARRDFTMNAMSLSLDGTLHDDFKGASDARVGRIRFVGDPRARIAEDHLRILRLFRFYAHYGAKPLAPSILEACRDNAGKLNTLPGERLRQELFKLLSAPNPFPAVAAMHATGVLKVLFPSAVGPNFLLKLVMVERAYGLSPHWLVRLAAIVAGSEEVAALTDRFKLSNTEAARLDAMYAPLPEISNDMPKIAIDAALYRYGAEAVGDRAALAVASGQRLAGWGQMFDAIRSWTPKPLPVGGEDVLAQGVPAGPEVGRLLAVAENAWIGSGFAAPREKLLEAITTARRAEDAGSKKDTAPGGEPGPLLSKDRF